MVKINKIFNLIYYKSDKHTTTIKIQTMQFDIKVKVRVCFFILMLFCIYISFIIFIFFSVHLIIIYILNIL